MKRIIKIALWILAAAYLLLVLAFVEKEYESVICRGVDVRIKDSLQYRFITADQVKQLVRGDNESLSGRILSEMNTEQMESDLCNLRSVSDAQVYSSVKGTLVVEVTQRIPVIRVMDRDHEDFYLDRDGYVIPAVRGYAPHLLLANGFIESKFRSMENVLEGNDVDKAPGTMGALLEIAALIARDPFWSAQIVQVYVNREGEFELIPRVGSHIILFGSGEQIETKFFKLRTLYEEGFSRKGWNQYEIINLKYDKQVICTKR